MIAARLYFGILGFGTCQHTTLFCRSYLGIFTMDTSRRKYRDDAFSSMNAAIRTLNIAKEVSSVAPARAAFHSVTVILATITVGFFPLSLCRSIPG